MTRITVYPNGPFMVEGETTLVDKDGNAWPTAERFALCRCGASAKLPFCDGAHKSCGFTDDAKAPAGE